MVKSDKMDNIAYVGLGTNKGDRARNIKDGLLLIDAHAEMNIHSISSIYETLPFGYKQQENFYNLAMKISTVLTPIDLLIELKNIEIKMGRVSPVKWGPREIDLDILFYNDLVFSDEIITLPHEGIQNRDFVLVPLCEIEKDLVHPVYNKTVCQLLSGVTESTIISKFSYPLLEKEIDFD